MQQNIHEADQFAEYFSSRSPELREALILNHVPLVRFVLGRLGLSEATRNDFEDLVHQGLMGLIEAFDRFDLSFGTQFSTYATIKIRGKVLDYLRSQDWVSRSVRQRSRNIQKAITQLTSEFDRIPTEEEIAKFLGEDLEKVQQTLAEASRVIVSLDALADDYLEDGVNLYDTLADERQEDPSEITLDRDQKARLIEALEQLPERDKLILSLYYFEELTLKEIGEVLKVSESRVSQLQSRAVMNLKAIMSDQPVNLGRRKKAETKDKPAAASLAAAKSRPNFIEHGSIYK